MPYEFQIKYNFVIIKLEFKFHGLIILIHVIQKICLLVINLTNKNNII